jgi:hypothetical protein
VCPNSGDAIAPLLSEIECRVRNKVRFQPVADTTAEDQVCEVFRTTFRSWDDVILSGHHESIVVSLQVHATVNAAPLIALEQLEKLRLGRLGHVSPNVK